MITGKRVFDVVLVVTLIAAVVWVIFAVRDMIELAKTVMQ